MQTIEMAGQKIIYKDLADLRGKLTGLLGEVREDRELHDRESKRLRQEEKGIQKMLGTDGAVPEDNSGSLA
jgi:hypothetical protein